MTPARGAAWRGSSLRLLFGLFGLCVLLAALPRTAHAQTDDPRRAYKLLRDDENWAWLRDLPPARADFWDRAKYVPLSRRRTDVYLTFGGEIRLWGEGYQNELWGATEHPQNGTFLQRYMLHADAHLSRYVRVFVQLKSGIGLFRLDGPRPLDQDLLDFNQFYIDAIAIPGRTPDDEPRLLLRGGRQELSFGSGRFVEAREGPNVRFGFDGLRVIARPGPVRIDAFVVRPSLTRPGVFDDAWDDAQWFWGVYGALRLPVLAADVYYLGRARESARFERAAGPEIRHTAGGRVRWKLSVLELELEAAYQFGALGALPIRAYTLAGEAVLVGERLFLRPRLVLGGGLTSGDQGPASASLGTFSAPFPRGAYFGMLSANGPSNNVAPHAALQLSLPASVSVLAEFWSFFRDSVHDGIYSVPGALLRPGADNPARYLGTQLEAWVTWQAGRHLTLSGTCGYFWTGEFFRASPPGEDITYAAGWMTYKF